MHTITIDGPIAYPGGKDGMYRAVCENGDYLSSIGPESQVRADAQTALDECREMAKQTFSPPKTQTPAPADSAFYFEWDRSLVPGHIRSEMGVKEFKISNCCEYHFDEAFATDEADEWDEGTQSAVGPIHGAT